MIFGLEQGGGNLIAPMALAHPLHPIDNRLRNKLRNLGVGWCVSSWWPWFPSRSSVLIYIYAFLIWVLLQDVYIYIYIYIQRECHSVLAKLHPITFYRIVFLGSARFLGWMPLFVFFGLPIVSCSLISPCGCGDLSVRLGSRISPHRHRVVVEVHWRGAQGWRPISWVVATFNHVGGSFNLLMAATGDVWIIPSFRIWGYVLHIEHISCVITNCG